MAIIIKRDDLRILNTEVKELTYSRVLLRAVPAENFVMPRVPR